MERQALGPGSIDQWLTSRFPRPQHDAEILSVFDSGGEDPQRALEYLGICLWSVLSDNRTAIDPHGKAVDLGSFRDSRNVLADWLNRTVDAYWFHAQEFYLSGIGLTSVEASLHDREIACFTLIFQRLCTHGPLEPFPKLNGVGTSMERSQIPSLA